MRFLLRFLVLLLVAVAVYTVRLGTQRFEPTPPPPATTTCTTFTNGQGGGWVCTHP